MRVLPLLLVLIAGSAHAESVFRCVDGDGKTTFTDRPCKQSGVVVELDESNNSTSYSDPSAEINTALELVRSSRERHDGQREKKALQAAKQKQLDGTCQQVTEYRDKLAGGGFFYRPDDTDMKALTDEEIAEEVASLNRQLAENCGKRG